VIDSEKVAPPRRNDPGRVQVSQFSTLSGRQRVGCAPAEETIDGLDSRFDGEERALLVEASAEALAEGLDEARGRRTEQRPPCLDPEEWLVRYSQPLKRNPISCRPRA